MYKIWAIYKALSYHILIWSLSKHILTIFNKQNQIKENTAQCDSHDLHSDLFAYSKGLNTLIDTLGIISP